MTWERDACTLPTEQVPLQVAKFDDRLWLDVRVPPGREPVLDGLTRQATAAMPKVGT